MVAAALLSCASYAGDIKPINVPPGDLTAGIETLIKQCGIQLIYQSDELQGLKTRGVTGNFTAEEALVRILQGTSLVVKTDPTGALSISNPKERPTSSIGSLDRYPVAKPTESGEDRTRSGGDHFRLAQATQGASTETPSVERNNEQAPQKEPATLQEVVVTAQKRSENLQEVPVPVIVVNSNNLLESNQLQLQEYFTRIPGLNVAPGTLGAPQLAIRGLTTGSSTNPTVGIVIDDIPYGSSTQLGGGLQVPNFDPGDLARVEVLRGPQGTLYGANSLGGLIKYVTVDPSTKNIEGRLEAGGEGVHNGDSLGYNIRGALNLPLGDTFAVRMSGFGRRDPGFIDNIQTGEQGVNRTDVAGGRLSALWRALDNLSVKLSAILQDTRQHGSPFIDAQPGLGDLQQSALRETGAFDSKVQAYSAIITALFGDMELTSLSGYSVNKLDSTIDYTFALGGPLTQKAFGVTGAPFDNFNRTSKYTQEVRLSVPLLEHLQWLFGAFFTNEDSTVQQNVWAADPATGLRVGEFLGSEAATTYREYAAFTDLTYNVTDRFDFQLGARESRNRQSYSAVWSGPYVPTFLGVPTPLLPPTATLTDNAFTYLVTPRFHPSRDLMIYARLASGYRPGGPSSNSTTHILPNFTSDTTQNYEIGVKGNTPDHILSFDTSVYYIDWKDIPIQIRDPVTRLSSLTNAARAKSQGIELSLALHPLSGFTLSSWVSWNDAELTKSLPPGSSVVAKAGDPLPLSSRFSGNLSADLDFALTGRATGFAGVSVSYVDGRRGSFTASGVRQVFPAYAQTDLKAGIRFDSWTTSLFVNNLTDKRGLLSSQATNPIVYYPIQPRTLGLAIFRTFSAQRQ